MFKKFISFEDYNNEIQLFFTSITNFLKFKEINAPKR